MRLQSPKRMQNKAAMEANFGLLTSDLWHRRWEQPPKPPFFIKSSSCPQREIQRVF
jgi:hypothetical protein